MFLLTSTLMFISTVVYESHAEQKLECPYESQNKDTWHRVWCKREAKNESCCTGFLLNSQLGSGHLSIQDDGRAFTVTVRSLPQGDGVYWCGLKDSHSSTFIKLAEKKLYNPMAWFWTVLRWLLFVLLLLSVVTTHMCCSRIMEKANYIT